MANGFTQSEQIFYEQVLEAFDPANVVARNATKFEPPMQAVERSGLTVRRPQPYIAEITTGLDVSSDYKDLTELTVPSTLAQSDIKNHAFQLTSLELNDPFRRQQAAISAAQALAAKIDTEVGNRVITYGSLVCTETGDFSSYDHLAKGETALMEREVNVATPRCLVLNPRMARKMGNELASRDVLQADNPVMNAYRRSILPPVAGFDTMKANVLTSLTGSASSGVTVDGAGQYKTPTPFTGGNSTAADNRFMTLQVSGSHGLVSGDCITIAGVNSVGMITKKDTGQLQTFRVISTSSTNEVVISPAIIPLDQSGDAVQAYANCTATPAHGANITVLNTDTTQPSIFFCKKAVEIFHGRLAVDQLGPTVSIMRETTDSGIEIIFARQGNIDNMTAKYRLTVWTSANVLEPQMCGIYLAGQNAAFG